MATEEETPTIACDFDGVINSYTSGWTGDTLPDPPVPGAIEWLEDITKACDVIIHTARIKPSQPGQEELIRKWLLKNGLSPEALGRLTFEGKVTATIYLDDRAIRFTGSNFPTAEEVYGHKAWNKQGRDRWKVRRR
jgi:hypothetical protein